MNPYMKAVSVIGAGTMGNGIAHVFALNGYPVRMADISPDALEKALLIFRVDPIRKDLGASRFRGRPRY